NAPPRNGLLQSSRNGLDFRKLRHKSCPQNVEAQPAAAGRHCRVPCQKGRKNSTARARNHSRNGASGYLVAPLGGGQKPGSLIALASRFSAYFSTGLPIAEAFPISTNTKFSAGKCFWITCFATSGVTASTCASNWLISSSPSP